MHIEFRAFVIVGFLISVAASHLNAGGFILGTDAPPATSVEHANRTFANRAAPAIQYNADQLLPNDGFNNEQNYGLRILGHLAYLDSLLQRDQAWTNRLQDVTRSLLQQRKKSELGTEIEETIEPFIRLERQGEYDVLLTAYCTILYKYSHLLLPDVRDHLLGLLTDPEQDLSGPFTLHYLQLVFLEAGVTVPETENHILMIYVARFLGNQLLYDRKPAPQYDNGYNGMSEWLLNYLRDILRRDFIEYNARAYQDYAMTALLNLYSYSKDPRVKVAAQMVLDYVSAKVAVSSNDGRRAVPYRRLRDHYCSGLLASTCSDPQTAFYLMLAGVTDMLPIEPLFIGSRRCVPESYAYEFQWAALSDYRIPSLIHDLFVNRDDRLFFQQFRPCGGQCGTVEIYSGSPSYLISAGGVETKAAYALKSIPLDIELKSKDNDKGLVLATTLMPTGVGDSVSNLIRFQSTMTWQQDAAPPILVAVPTLINLGVAPNFACGLYPIIPSNYQSDLSVTGRVGGVWKFFNREGNRSKGRHFGYFVAVFEDKGWDRLTSTFVPFGFLEAFDTYLNPEVSFRDWVKGVLERNWSNNFDYEGFNTYETFSHHRIQFDYRFGASILSVTGGPAVPLANTGTKGTILNSDDAGLVTIDNPGQGRRLILDARNAFNPVRFEDILAGPEVWVDFGYRGNEVGTYTQPFNTLEEGVERVPVDGIVKILPGSRRGAFAFANKAMTLAAPAGRVTLGQ